MKLNTIIAAVTAFAAATLVQAETAALRGAMEPSSSVARRALRDGSPCGTIICRDPRDPPYIVNDPASQARSADAVEPAAQPTAIGETLARPCDPRNTWCRPTRPPMFQGASTDGVERVAQPAPNVEAASGSPCNFWNNWCRGPPPHVVNDPVPQAPSADEIKSAAEAAANVETAARKGTPCGTIICRDPRDPPYVVSDPVPQGQSVDAVDGAHQ